MYQIETMVSLCRLVSLNSSPLLPSASSKRHLSSAFCSLKTKKVVIGFCLSLPRQQKPSKPASFSSMEAPPDGYRRNVGICLTNPSNKIFVASRIDIPGAWQMPQGGIDEGEDPKSAAIRELREETGVTSAEILAEVSQWLTYDFPPHVREKLNKQWGSNWKGQAQKWFLLKFTGKEEEINLLGDGTEKAEFAEWSWMTPQEVLERVVSFKKPIYEEVLKVFGPYLDPDSTAQV